MSADNNNQQQFQFQLPFEVIDGAAVAAASPMASGAPAPPAAPAAPEATTPISTHSMQHTGVSCDNCHKTVSGFRYKCCQCRDYDLCAACEQLGVHAGHVMLRIPFPEMAREAIRTHILKASRMQRERSPSQPVIHLGFGAPAGAGAAGGEEEYGHCKKRRHGNGKHGGKHPYHRHFGEQSTSSSESSSDEAPFPFGPFGAGTGGAAGGGGCPVMTGKKEMKKWCKYMKKNAHVHKRAAKEYAKSFRAAEGAANATPGAGAGAEGFDLGAAAHQIQEYLNAAGIPIDVVELYNEWGTSHGTAGAPAAAAAAGGQDQAAGAPAAAPTPATDAAANVAEDLQHLNLNTGNNEQAPAAASAPAAAAPEGATAATVAKEVQGVPAPAATPAQAPRIYPQLNPVHLQNMMTGIGNAVRNIPIMPWNAAAGAASGASAPAPEGATPPAAAAAGGGQLGERMQQTLNQLLSMGFSNQDGWLGRLVASKKGNLEAVLEALFPVGGAAAPTGEGVNNGAHGLD